MLRAVANEGGGGGGLGGKGAAVPPGPVEPDKSSLWMDLFSLDSVIFVKVTCNCLPFSYWRSIFSKIYLMTSAENNVWEPPNLKLFSPPPIRKNRPWCFNKGEIKEGSFDDILTCKEGKLFLNYSWTI